MLVARVVGNVVATKKEEALLGKKLMLVCPLRADGCHRDNLQVAVDSVGTGIGETVLLTRGSAARMTDTDADRPIDLNIVGIIDSMEVGGDDLFKERL